MITLDQARRIITAGESEARSQGQPIKIITIYGCNSCHTIPGVNGANGLVGPPLTNMGARTYVGGVLQNTPANMMQWIQNPPAVDPKTAMPNLHVSQRDARDITTYLYTLQ